MTTIQIGGKLCIIVVKYLNMVMPICAIMLVGTKACNLVVHRITTITTAIHKILSSQLHFQLNLKKFYGARARSDNAVCVRLIRMPGHQKYFSKISARCQRSKF